MEAKSFWTRTRLNSLSYIINTWPFKWNCATILCITYKNILYTQWCSILYTIIQQLSPASGLIHPHKHSNPHGAFHLSYLHCGDPPSAGPSPAWWPICGRPRGPAPSLPHPAGPSRGVRWKTPHYQSGSGLPGKRELKNEPTTTTTTTPPWKDGNSCGASNYSVLDQLEESVQSWICGMTQVDTIWGPSSPSPRLIQCHGDFTLSELMSQLSRTFPFTFFFFLINS